MTREQSKKLINKLHAKYYGDKKKVNAVASESGVSRNDLMLKAKEQGIKNFRILNKAELEKVLDSSLRPEDREGIVNAAITRWKAGWGARKHEQAAEASAAACA